LKQRHERRRISLISNRTMHFETRPPHGILKTRKCTSSPVACKTAFLYSCSYKIERTCDTQTLQTFACYLKRVFGSTTKFWKQIYDLLYHRKTLLWTNLWSALFCYCVSRKRTINETTTSSTFVTWAKSAPSTRERVTREPQRKYPTDLRIIYTYTNTMHVFDTPPSHTTNIISTKRTSSSSSSTTIRQSRHIQFLWRGPAGKVPSRDRCLP